jgi:glycosyltransferase EpsD
MNKKVLFCATVDTHIRAFHVPYMRFFKNNGWEVHVAARGELELPYTDKKFDVPFTRSPFSRENMVAYRNLKSIIHDNAYSIVHCHTPVGGVLARLAARRARKNGTKVIYTAHGFHFYRGASLVNWLIYYPIEKWLSRYTDCLITINHEDYDLAVKHKFHARKIEYVHGVGIDVSRFQPVTQDEKRDLRRQYGYSDELFLLFYAAELNANKNQGLLIKAVAEVRRNIPSVRLLLAGRGAHEEQYRALARDYNVDDCVDFLGYRNDIDRLLAMSDVAVASSLREGLPVNILEAMTSSLPIVATDIRGHRDLVVNGSNGFLVNPTDSVEMSAKLVELYGSADKCKELGRYSLERAQEFKLESVLERMTEVYRDYM